MPEVLMPRLSDTMTEGVLTRWLKEEGEDVHRGDVLAEIETDKATMDLEAYDDGVLERILVAENTTVPIGEPVAVIGQQARAGEAKRGTGARPDRSTSATAGATKARIRTSPLARKVARDHGIDLASLVGTGPGGRIVNSDVKAAVAAIEKPLTDGAAPSRGTGPRPPIAPAASDELTDDLEVPLTAVRRITARRLTQSTTVPHFDLTIVVDAGEMLAFRGQVNRRAQGAKVSVTDLLVRACAVTLRRHLQVNSSWAEDHILQHRRIHVGVAVALDDGLIVPVIRDADRKSLGEIAAETRALSERARAGHLTPDEYAGGTFTISNLGMHGIDHFTAVLNPPEAAILAVGAASDEPVVVQGQVTSRTIIKLTLSVDHRVLDGSVAAAFLHDLKDTLEEPLGIVL